MAARETGEVRKQLSDKEAAPYIGKARLLLGQMKEQMKYAKLLQLQWKKVLENGVIIVVASIFGQDSIQILVPEVKAEQVVEKKEEPPVKKELESRLWLLMLNNSITYIIDHNTGQMAADQTPAANIPPIGPDDPPITIFLVAEGKYWGMNYGFAAAIDTLYSIDYKTGEKVNVATRDYGGLAEGSHSYNLTYAEDSVLWVVGRVNPKIYNIDPKTGEVRYVVDVPANASIGTNWIGERLHIVNDGEKAYTGFTDTAGSLRGVLITDIATGNTENHNHSANYFDSPESGYSFEKSNFIMGNDGSLYGIAITALADAPWFNHHAIRIDKDNYGIEVIGDVGDYVTSTSDYFLNSDELHVSVARNGLCFISSEFNYIVVDTKSGEIVGSGSSIDLLGKTTELTFSGGRQVADYVHRNGLIFTDKSASTVSFGFRAGHFEGGSPVMDNLFLVHLDLSTMQVEKLDTGLLGNFDHFHVEYIGEEDEEGNTPAILSGKNVIINTQ